MTPRLSHSGQSNKPHTAIFHGFSLLHYKTSHAAFFLHPNTATTTTTQISMEFFNLPNLVRALRLSGHFRFRDPSFCEYDDFITRVDV